MKKTRKKIIITGGCEVDTATGEILKPQISPITQKNNIPPRDAPAAMLKKREMPKPEAEVTVGLVCRKCGCGHFETYCSRPLPGGKVRRYKQCRNCGTTVRTLEKIDETT